MCKLWEIEGRYRESNLSSARFAPHHPNFLGALSTHPGEPQARTTLSPLNYFKDVLLPVAGGRDARFRSLDRRVLSHCNPHGAWLETRLRVKWGAERGV